MTGEEWYELRAKAFYYMRGLKAPGIGENPITEADKEEFATRTAAWHAWNGVNGNVLSALRHAIEQ